MIAGSNPAPPTTLRQLQAALFRINITLPIRRIHFMARNPIKIGHLSFPTKKEAKAHFRAIRDRNPPRLPIKGTDHHDLKALINVHPHKRIKVGVGVSGFFVDEEPKYKTLCFWVRRSDESVTDLSFIGAIDGANARADCLQALRQAVEEQIYEFRQTLPSVFTCPFRACRLTPDNCHVDHVPPSTFETLVENWLCESGLDSLDDVVLQSSKDCVIGNRLGCPEQTRSWQNFHQKHARLRAISKAANLRDVRKVAQKLKSQ